MRQTIIEISFHMSICMLFPGGLTFSTSHCCGPCPIDVSIVNIISVSLEIKSIDERWVSVVGPNPLRSIQPSPTGHLVNTLRSPQAFTGKGRTASSFNAPSHRHQWRISPTHYLIHISYGTERVVHNIVIQIFFFKNTF